MERRAVRGGPGEGLVVAGLAALGAERGAHLVVGHTEPVGAGAPDGQAGQPRLGVLRARSARPPRRPRRTGSARRVHEARYPCAASGLRQPGGDVRGDRPEVLLAHVLDAVATRRRLEQGQAERWRAAAQGLEQATGNAASAAPRPTVRRSTAPARRGTPCAAAAARRRGRTCRAGRPVRPPAEWRRGRWCGASSPGRSGGPGRSGSGHGAASVSASAVRAVAGSDSICRTSASSPAARRASSASASGSWISPVWTSWRSSVCTSRDRIEAGAVARAGSSSRCSSLRAEQLARSEEERRRVLAAGGDDVVGRILEPGPQAAGQAGVETGAGGGIAAQQRQDLGSRAAVRRRVARRCRPEQGAGCDEDHRCSVPTGCDSPSRWSSTLRRTWHPRSCWRRPATPPSS